MPIAGQKLTLVVVEIGEQLDQLLLVLGENLHNGRRLVGIGNKHLENVECFKLDILAVVFEQHHHYFEVVWVADVPRHHIEVRSVEEELSK